VPPDGSFSRQRLGRNGPVIAIMTVTPLRARARKGDPFLPREKAHEGRDDASIAGYSSPDIRNIMSVTLAVKCRLPIDMIADFYDHRIVSEHQDESQ
jgi:hypothetical protein